MSLVWFAPLLCVNLSVRSLSGGVIFDFVQKLVRLRCAQERELRRGWRHGELHAAGGVAVSPGAAKLCATSDVSSQKCGAAGGGPMVFTPINIF